jgi:glucose/arabinose dehydrogenase
MNPTRRTAMLMAASIVAALVTSCHAGSSPTGSPSSAAPTSGSAGEALSTAGSDSAVRTVATGLDAPWSVIFHRGTALISERDSARILELADGGTARVVATIDGVHNAGEGGLLGLATDGEQRLYAYSTGRDGNRIQRFAISGVPGSLELGEPETLVDGIPSASYHDGGRIAFGADGMLYATVGDAGRPHNAQDLESLGGKILRMDADGGVPKDNPFPGSLIYSYGHRNPQGLAWDDDGTMFATEFGQNTWDELNIITPGSNYGWPLVEGIAETGRFTDPVQQWEPAEASPSGMAHVNGMLYIANLRGQVLRAVPVADPGTSSEYYRGEFGRIRHVVAGPDEGLWILTNNTDGRGTPGPEDDRLVSVRPAAR